MAYTVTKGSTVYGNNNPWCLDGDQGAVKGLHDVTARLYDFDRRHAAGGVKGPQFLVPQPIVVSLTAVFATAVLAESSLNALIADWQPLSGATTQSLTIVLAASTYTCTGAPAQNAVTADTTKMQYGLVNVDCTFLNYSGAPVVT